MAKNQEPAPLTPKGRRIIFNTLSFLLLLGIIAWGVAQYFHLNNGLYSDDAQVEAYINPINARIQGYVKEIRFNENQEVSKGDTLLVIDDREYKIQMEQALANLRDVEAGANIAEADVAVASNTTTVSDANLEEMEARLDNQRINLKRYENLLKEDVVSEFQYDQVKTEYDAMQAKYNALRGQKRGSQLSTHAAQSKIAVSAAAIQNARAAVELARLNISYCYITAPYNGIMGRRKIAAGQLISSGQPVATIVQGGEKWVTVNFTEKQIAAIRTGDLVTMRIDALKDKKFQGQVQSISGATGSRYSAVPVDNATGNFVKVEQRIPVKIVFTAANQQADLAQVRAGMNVEITGKSK